MSVNILSLLQTMMQAKGSDLHIATNSPPMMRVRGDMAKILPNKLTHQEVEAMVHQITPPAQKTELQKTLSADFAFKAPGIGIFRANVFFQRQGLSIVMRALSESPPRIEDLKLPEICTKVCSYANGLVLVTGPTGSGKSTTLAAMINYINETTPGHILTLEDPIEFQHESKMCMMNQRSLGVHFTSFASAIRAALREDPDVILIGEMRDPETVALAIKAAETGHLVFGTLHTNSAAKSIDRIINTFPAEEQTQIRTVLSETMRAVISQKLVPTSDGKRRVCIHDIMVNNSAVANLIREGKCFQIPTVMQTGRKEGMQVMDRVLLELAEKGEVLGEVAWEMANEKNLFQKWAPKDGPVAPPVTASGVPGMTSGMTPGAPHAPPLGSVPHAPTTPPPVQPSVASSIPGVVPPPGKKAA